MTDEETAFEPLENSDELRLLRAFAEHGVRSIVVGGYAVRVHGRFRPPGDLDLVVEPVAENLDRMKDALAALGVADAAAVRELFSLPAPGKWDWRDGLLDRHVDLLSAALPFSFADLASRATELDYEGLRLLVISRDHLIASKRAALMDPNRHDTKKAQDREDLEALLGCGKGSPTGAGGFSLS